MADERDTRRSTDVWPIVKRNAPAIIIVGGLIVAMVTLYNDVLYHNSIINPTTMAEWTAERAKAKADLEATKRLSDQRHCMTKAWLSGISPKSTLECLN